MLLKNWKIWTALAAAVALFLAGRWTVQGKTTIETRFEKIDASQEQIAQAVTSARSEWEKTQKTEKIRIISKKPDGSSEERTEERSETADKGKKESSETKVTENRESTTRETKTKTETVSAQPSWMVGADAPVAMSTLEKPEKANYSLFVGRRVVGPFWLSASYQTQTKGFGLGLRFTF